MNAAKPMTRDVLVIPPELGLDAAHRIMKRRRIRHLPVVRGGELLGILSDRDVLLRARQTDDGMLVVPTTAVALAMTTEVVTCEPTTEVSTLVQVMTERKIDAVPVISGSGRLVGLVTSTDLLLLLLAKDEAQPLPFTFRLFEGTDQEVAEA